MSGNGDYTGKGNKGSKGSKSSKSHKGNKAHLPSKPCLACGLQMSWRKAWAKNWAEVRYCSDACRKQKSKVNQHHGQEQDRS